MPLESVIRHTPRSLPVFSTRRPHNATLAQETLHTYPDSQLRVILLQEAFPTCHMNLGLTLDHITCPPVP